MSDDSVIRDLFDHWEQVWHEGRYDLVGGRWPRTTSGMMNRALGG